MGRKQFNQPSESKPRKSWVKIAVNVETIFACIERERSAQQSPQTEPSTSSISQPMLSTSRSMGDGGIVNLSRSNSCSLIRKRKFSVPDISNAKVKFNYGSMEAKLKQMLLDRKIAVMKYDISKLGLKYPLPEVTLHEEIKTTSPESLSPQ